MKRILNKFFVSKGRVIDVSSSQSISGNINISNDRFWQWLQSRLLLLIPVLQHNQVRLPALSLEPQMLVIHKPSLSPHQTRRQLTRTSRPTQSRKSQVTRPQTTTTTAPHQRQTQGGNCALRLALMDLPKSVQFQSLFLYNFKSPLTGRGVTRPCGRLAV